MGKEQNRNRRDGSLHFRHLKEMELNLAHPNRSIPFSGLDALIPKEPFMHCVYQPLLRVQKRLLS